MLIHVTGTDEEVTVECSVGFAVLEGAGPDLGNALRDLADIVDDYENAHGEVI